MPAPTCTCIVCGNQTSKRQSLRITHKGEAGRACREHPEVIAYIQSQFESEENEKHMKSVNSLMQVLTITAYIEVQRLMNPLFMEAHYLRRTKHAYGEDVTLKVQQELSKRKPLTPADMVGAFLTLQQLQKTK